MQMILWVDLDKCQIIYHFLLRGLEVTWSYEFNACALL